MTNRIINHHGNVEEVSAPAFTPGMWRLRDTDYIVQSEDGEAIADCGTSWSLLATAMEANARLIAAAPDLYEALVALVDAHHGAGPKRVTAKHVAFLKAKDAITKALGEQQ